MKNNQLESYPARARSDPSLPAGVRGDPQDIAVLWIDPPEQFGSRGHPPEVRYIKNGPPADSVQEPPKMLNFRMELQAESINGKGLSGWKQKLHIRCLKSTAKDIGLIAWNPVLRSTIHCRLL